MSKVDLHVHTTASDGRYTPTEIVRRAAKSGLAVLAITDHDTVDGIPEALDAAREFPELEVIPGVEINTDVPTGEAHVLGYFIDYTHPELLSVLRDMRASRQERAQKMVAKLADLGMPLDWERVKQLAGTDSIGRPHIAQALLEKGYISTFREAFDRYISRDGPAYVERTKVTPAGRDQAHLAGQRAARARPPVYHRRPGGDDPRRWPPAAWSASRPTTEGTMRARWPACCVSPTASV